VTICPCCGFKFEGALSTGCEGCGARSVGEPLPKPERELPSYARSLILAVTGFLMVVVFLTQTVIALIQRATINLWSVIAAAETAAWRLKWAAIPATILVLWFSRKVYRSMLQSPERFCGFRMARTGLAASAVVPVLIAVLIGVTVPERLRQRADAAEAGTIVVGRTIDRAIFEYKMRFERVPNDLNDLKQLPDPDGSIAAALAVIDVESNPTAYKPTVDVAASQKPQSFRGAALRKASLSTDDNPMGEGLAFTNYELPLPGPDKIFGTEDDMILRDGLITKASEATKPILSTTASAKPEKR
jgi:hypothetical protein